MGNEKMHTKEDAEKVYRLFRDTPDAGKSSELHNHYRRGRQEIMKPEPNQVLALAAWRAGRDAARADRKRR